MKTSNKPRRSITHVLNDWLEKNHGWDYKDVLSLLDELEEKGYSHLTDNKDGRKAIAEYLENHKYSISTKENIHKSAIPIAESIEQ